MQISHYHHLVIWYEIGDDLVPDLEDWILNLTHCLYYRFHTVVQWLLPGHSHT